MNSKLLTGISKALDVPEISKHIFNYLTSRNERNYKKLEAALKAYEFTAEQLLDNIDTEKFLESYRSTNAINSSIYIIKNSKEFSDKEKCEYLGQIHEKEVKQQRRGEIYDSFKKITSIIGIIVILQCVSVFVIKIMKNKLSVSGTQNKKINFMVLPLIPFPFNIIPIFRLFNTTSVNGRLIQKY